MGVPESAAGVCRGAQGCAPGFVDVQGCVRVQREVRHGPPGRIGGVKVCSLKLEWSEFCNTNK